MFWFWFWLILSIPFTTTHMITLLRHAEDSPSQCWRYLYFASWVSMSFCATFIGWELADTGFQGEAIIGVVIGFVFSVTAGVFCDAKLKK